MAVSADDARLPLDEIGFLARSEHRVEVLDALTERPHSRADLRALTGASSSTIGRMLGEFEERCWVERVGHHYETTPLGAFVAEGVMALLERMETERTLRDVVHWLPTDDVGFDVIQCLSDAEVVFPTESDPMAPVRHAGAQLRAGARLRFITTQVTVSYFDSVTESVARDGMTVEGVVTPDVYDTLVGDTDLATVYRELSDSDGAVFFVADDIPLIVQIIDDAVGIGLVDEANNPRGLVCSDDERVHQWAVDTFETCRDGAEPVSEP